MNNHVCRLCGRKNREGCYCPDCVPRWQLRKQLNTINPDTANMVLVDFRAKNDMGYPAAAHFAGVDKASWRAAELGKELTKRLMIKIAEAIEVDVARLFQGYTQISYSRQTGNRIIKGVLPKAEAIDHSHITKKTNLKPGESQHLLSMDCRKAKEAGYGHSYGLWRAGVII